MKRKLTHLLALLLLFALLPLPARADMGPKPTTEIRLLGLEEDCWGTLLSSGSSTGPYSHWGGEEEYLRYEGDLEEAPELWEKFEAYEDPDGFYFLQTAWHCSGEGRLAWTYYPPETFKLLLYFPATDRYEVSPVYERHAFESRYTVDLAGERGPEGTLLLERSYDIAGEVVPFLKRLALTLVLEGLLALLFGFGTGRALGVILAVNVLTQVGLNLALHSLSYGLPYSLQSDALLVLEGVIFIAEAIAWRVLLPRAGKRPVSGARAFGYSLCANGLSYFGGLFLGLFLPL